MYICPSCSKRFKQEDIFTKHFLSCWKKNNPNHKSKDAPRGEDVETRNMNEDMKAFFERKIV